MDALEDTLPPPTPVREVGAPGASRKASRQPVLRRR